MKKETERPVEYCCRCDCATGRAGVGEDSLYTASDGPFCEDCFDAALFGLRRKGYGVAVVPLEVKNEKE